MSVESAGLRLVRVSDPDGNARVGVVAGDELGLLGHDDMIGTLERGEVDSVLDSVPIRDAETLALPEPWRVLVPIVAPETWAAGVTYERSREARTAESQRRDVYDLVYDAERPELFLKDAAGRRTVGPGEPIAVRSDASWSVPEPELAVVLGAGARPLAVTIGNDVSSRDIEGANPLYLPQAKIYGRACALGPALLVPLDWSVSYEIELRIFDASGQLRFEDGTSTASMCRSISTLTEFLRRDNPVPAGSVLLTGTGIVPPDEVSLTPGQTVEIRIPGIGVLRSPVGGAAHLNEPKEDQANV
ncbi:MAG: fumarylacetoacetate hydrolase family protein [Solirubrobacterales bacterium]|nr:fumarylacetoacetate hydrolase family protein [Solirubrobacterales bacterium]